MYQTGKDLRSEVPNAGKGTRLLAFSLITGVTFVTRESGCGVLVRRKDIKYHDSITF